jgi:serine/threonine protein kinase
MNPSVIEGPTQRYTIKGIKAEGDLATLYDGTYANGGGDHHVVVKITRDKENNDLVWNEAGILAALAPSPTSTFFHYIPNLLDSFETKDGKRVNVLDSIPTPVASFEDILRAYPKGLDYRDVVWMYKRTLIGLGYAHTKGVVHGAVIPPHVMIFPETHGAHIVDWSYALNFASIVVPKVVDPKVKAPIPPKAKNAWEKLLADAEYDPDPVRPKGPPPDPNRMYVKAISVAWESFYAPEILVKRTPTPATDLFQAAKCAVYLLGGDVETNQMPDTVPPQVKAFLQASLLPATSARPQDAWELHDSFDRLMLAVVGERKFRPFVMPPRN